MAKRGFKEEIRDCFPRNKRGIAIPINVDIDGTIIYHGYDFNEQDFKINGKSVETLKRWADEYNCAYNIYTTRDGDKLQEAINIFEKNGIPFESIDGNPQQKKWTLSKKQFGFVIDDMSCTKIFYDENGRATVDWDFVVEVFEPRLKLMKKLITEIENE